MSTSCLLPKELLLRSAKHLSVTSIVFGLPQKQTKTNTANPKF